MILKGRTMTSIHTIRGRPAESVDLSTRWSEGDGTMRDATDAETWDTVLRIDDDQELRYAMTAGSDSANGQWADDATSEDVVTVLHDCARRLQELGLYAASRNVWRAADPIWGEVAA